MTDPDTTSRPPGLSLLVVDDFEIIRESLRSLLTSHGHYVTIAANADEGIELVNSMEFDAAIIDYEMPGADGLVLLAEIQRKYPLLPVIVVSGAIDVTRAIQLANAGVFRVAQKPVGSEWLLSALSEACQVNDIRRRAAFWSARITVEPTPARSNTERRHNQEQIDA